MNIKKKQRKINSKVRAINKKLPPEWSLRQVNRRIFKNTLYVWLTLYLNGTADSGKEVEYNTESLDSWVSQRLKYYNDCCK